MSDGSYTRFNLAFESTPGVTPGTIASMYQFPLVRQTMRHQMPKAKSRIITANRDVYSTSRLSRGAAGRIDTELMYPVTGKALLQCILASLCHDPAAEDAQVSVASVTIANGTPPTLTRASGSWITDKVEAGDIVKISGASDDADNIFVLVTQRSSATVLQVEIPDGAAFVTDGDVVTIKRGARSKNGTHRSYFSCERLWTDLGTMIGWTGQVFNMMDINCSLGQISTIGFDLVGFDGQSAAMSNTSSPYQGFPGTITYVAETPVPVLEPTGIQTVVLNGISYGCSGLSLKTNNNARVRNVFGLQTPDAIPVGYFEVTGTLSAYMAVLDPIQLYEDNTDFTMWTIMDDGEGRYIGISLGNVNIDDLGVDTDGANSDEIVQASWTATLSDWGESIRFFRFQ